MLLIVSGFAGSGKSTLAELLAEKFKLRCVHASGLLKELKDKLVSDLPDKEFEKNTGWWESKEGKAYLEKRLKDSSMDKSLDKELLKIAGKGNVVLDSWTMPWLCKKGFKVWLKASPEIRAKRVSGRDNLDYNEVLQNILERDKKTSQIYEKIYGFKLGKDFSQFDLVLDTDPINAKEVFEAVTREIEEKVLKK